MGKDTIIILNNGVRVSFTSISVEFMDELEKFFDERGIPKKNIRAYLAVLARREKTINID